MEPFTTLSGVGAPIDIVNCDTDRIIPARFLRKQRVPGYERWLFHDMRFDAAGNERPEFVLNQAPYRNARILVAAANYGCGSSREQAVYAMHEYGILSVIAPSFGDIHYGNALQNGFLPIVLAETDCARLRGQLHAGPGAALTIDLPAQTVTGPDGALYRFDIDAAAKERLVKGLDDVGLVLQHIERIEGFEQRYLQEHPWVSV
ncbi:MAG: 3-isopropylmalate dehydratase small subunit [Betaproteobacteria bacterium]|nr:3-isopropylmalate dehydratase small subunit [Betaproteobacteria bacterium]